jgi:hypothetical protein
MTYENFALSGEGKIRELVNGIGLRANRMIDALEKFICIGDDLGTEVMRQPRTGRREQAVFLTPSREALRGEPDAAALLLIDYRAQTLQLVHIYEEYGGSDGPQWPDVVSRAQFEIKE